MTRPESGQGLDRRRASRDAGERTRAEGIIEAQSRGGAGRGPPGHPGRHRQDAAGRPGHGRADPRHRHGSGALAGRQRRTTACRRTPGTARTARSSASSSPSRSSRSAIRPLASSPTRASTRADVAHRVRGDRADTGGGGASRRARQEGRGLTSNGLDDVPVQLPGISRAARIPEPAPFAERSPGPRTVLAERPGAGRVRPTVRGPAGRWVSGADGTAARGCRFGKGCSTPVRAGSSRACHRTAWCLRPRRRGTSSGGARRSGRVA